MASRKTESKMKAKLFFKLLVNKYVFGCKLFAQYRTQEAAKNIFI